MKILFLSFGVWDYDGRTRELVNVCESVGHTEFITQVASESSRQCARHHCVKTGGSLSYLVFLIKCISVAIRMREIDVLFVDNRRAVIPALGVRLLKKPGLIVHDVRELYLMNETGHFVGKIGCLVEQFLMRRSNLVVSANSHRALIMKDRFGLRNTPEVYENVRQLKYIQSDDKEKFSRKYRAVFAKDTTKIVATSGYSIKRMTDKLVLAMENLGPKFELFLIGGGTAEDKSVIEDIIQERHLKNVRILGQLAQSELKYVVSNCDIGIVNYHQSDTNNLYCASGKIYEFLFEGLPVVTTENIPLVEMCERYGLGIADNNFRIGIQKVADNYEYFAGNVMRYVDSLSVAKNNQVLADAIMQEWSKVNAHGR